MFRKKNYYFNKLVNNDLFFFIFKYMNFSYDICYYNKQQVLMIFKQNNKLYFLFNNVKFNLLTYSRVINFFKKLNYIYSSKLTIIGLGFKCFIYKTYLFLLLGFSHYILYKIPKEIKLFCKKKTIFLTSFNKQKLFIFHKLIQNSRKPNIYKGKGLIEFKQFKTFIKLKKGKKQQYI